MTSKLHTPTTLCAGTSLMPIQQRPLAAVNPFAEPQYAVAYEEWYSGPGRRADAFEKRLLGRLLAGFASSRTALEIGCGTGHFSRWLALRNVEVTGLDISGPMLAEARTSNGTQYILGDALNLPVMNQAFDLALLITALEFVGDPHRALAEAVRVARHGLILGVLNRWSLLALKYRHSEKVVWKSARFFSLPELVRLVRAAAGRRLHGVEWRTTIWPIPWVRDLGLPFGGFIGLAAHLAHDQSGKGR